MADEVGSLLEPQRGMRWIVPGRPEVSPLFDVIAGPEGERGVLPMHRLRREEIEILWTWVASIGHEESNHGAAGS